MECLALWTRVLLDVDYSQLLSLFPTGDGDRGFSWALATARLLQNLRNQLAAGGLTIRKIATDFSEVLEEPQRWGELAWLEESYLRRVEQAGRIDPGESRIRQAAAPHVPEGTTRIVLACTPDPDSIALAALARLSSDYEVQVLIHAPDEMSHRFDEWGRPTIAEWRDAIVEIPDTRRNLRLSGVPSEQSKLAMSILAEDMFGPLDIGIGMPDSEVVPFMAAEMARVGVEPFNPEGKPLSAHPLFVLLERYGSLVDNRSYASVASFLRHPDVLHHLYHDLGLSSRRLLTELDEFQNMHLPADLQDILGRLDAGAAGGRQEEGNYSALTAAMDYLRSEILPNADMAATVGIRSCLQQVFSHRRLSADEPADVEFTTVAQQVDDLLTEYEQSCVAELDLAPRDIRTLLLEQLRPARFEFPRPAGAIDLEGWLELHWNDAPFLIVTGMNEGKVPESVTSDPFLPDSLRRQLGLRHDDDRFARDTYLMQAFVESRRSHGRACFLLGKSGSGGDPLKPSRLLFNCADSELAERARMLFGTPESRTTHFPATTTFLLRPSPPADVPVERENIQSLAVTGFKDYLVCPFRFYLKRVLRMEQRDDRKKELDSLDFGSLIHEVLSRMAAEEEVCRAIDAPVLTRFLHREASRWMSDRFGTSLPLNLQMQLDAACERLSAVAHAQAHESADGWEIVLVEFPVETDIEGLRVHGRIDRVDRHRETGRIRLLDYKTSDFGQTPEKEHLKAPSEDLRDYTHVVVDGKERRWADLQLPLYAMLLASQDAQWANVVPGYFSIPGSVDETRVNMWDGFTKELMDSAAECARGVAREIRSRTFWPPAPRVPNDDFESLFHIEPEKCVHVESFQEYMRRTA